MSHRRSTADLILTRRPDPDDRSPPIARPKRWRSAAVGSSRSVPTGDRSEGCPGHATRVVDLRGRTVCPGFGDAHVHPVDAGLTMLRCDLDGVRGLDALPRAHRDIRRDAPRRPWIDGGGWSMADFPGGTPRREDLDRIVPDRPVYLENRDGHTAWVNVEGARAGRHHRDTPDRDDGRIERDPDGRADRDAPRGRARRWSSG